MTHTLEDVACVLVAGAVAVALVVVVVVVVQEDTMVPRLEAGTVAGGERSDYAVFGWNPRPWQFGSLW